MTARTVELALRQLSQRVRTPAPSPRLRDQLLDDYRSWMSSAAGSSPTEMAGS